MALPIARRRKTKPSPSADEETPPHGQSVAITDKQRTGSSTRRRVLISTLLACLAVFLFVVVPCGIVVKYVARRRLYADLKTAVRKARPHGSVARDPSGVPHLRLVWATSISGTAPDIHQKGFCTKGGDLTFTYEQTSDVSPHSVGLADALIYYARDVQHSLRFPWWIEWCVPGFLKPGYGLAKIHVPSEYVGFSPSVANVVYTEESTSKDRFLLDSEMMSRFHIYVGFDPRSSKDLEHRNSLDANLDVASQGRSAALPTQYILSNFGLDVLLRRWRIPHRRRYGRVHSMPTAGDDRRGVENFEILGGPTSLRSNGTARGRSGAVVWAARNCHAESHRLEYLQSLSKHVEVHSLGGCWRTHDPNRNIANTDEPATSDLAAAASNIRKSKSKSSRMPTVGHMDFGGLSNAKEEEWAYMGRKYKFWYAAENYLCDGYVTEKMYIPLAYGSIPIVYGTDSHVAYAPSKDAIIDVRDYPTAADLAKHLVRIDNDEALYASYHAWRRRPLRELSRGFQEIIRTMEEYDENLTDGGRNFMCRLGDAVLGLQHDQQRRRKEEEAGGSLPPMRSLKAFPACPSHPTGLSE